MWNFLLIALLLFLNLFSGQAVALQYEYLVSGNSMTVKFLNDDTSDVLGNVPCAISRNIMVGFTMCGSPNAKVEGGEKFQCDTNWRFDAKQGVKQYIQDHGGVGNPFTITKPTGVSDNFPYNRVCLSAIDYENNLWLPDISAGGAEGTPVQSFVTCSLGSTSLTFAHGNLTSTEVNGNSVSKNLSVTCSDATSVNVVAGPNATSTTGSIPLSSDGALVSNISANGINLTSQGVNINMPKGMSTISVSSTLQAGSGFNKAGSYNGNGVIIISPQ